VSSPEQAVQVYTAARIAVDLDGEEEHASLMALAAQLGIDRSPRILMRPRVAAPTATARKVAGRR
jgi:uncharacterized membrane protein YebE (DUF533 family)